MTHLLLSPPPPPPHPSISSHYSHTHTHTHAQTHTHTHTHTHTYTHRPFEDRITSWLQTALQFNPDMRGGRRVATEDAQCLTNMDHTLNTQVAFLPISLLPPPSIPPHPLHLSLPASPFSLLLLLYSSSLCLLPHLLLPILSKVQYWQLIDILDLLFL